MDEQREDELLSTIIFQAASIIRNACERRHKIGLNCKGCPFNKLVNMDGEYDDYDWTDEDDEEGNNITYCEVNFNNIPCNWDLEEKQNE